MGLDASLVIYRTGQPLSPQRLRELSYSLACCVPAAFVIEKGKPLDILGPLQEWQDPIRPGQEHIDINVTGRYYSPSYARGYWPHYVAIAEWVKANLPNSTLFYGADHDYYREMTDSFIENVSSHFYLRHRTDYFSPAEEGPKCLCAGMPMWNNGGGPGVLSFQCLACGNEVEVPK